MAAVNACGLVIERYHISKGKRVLAITFLSLLLSSERPVLEAYFDEGGLVFYLSSGPTGLQSSWPSESG